jgi:RNA-dependent RNA polymerase
MNAPEFRFTTCLDSAKTGLRLGKEAFKEDQKRYGRPRASCMVAPDKSEQTEPTYQTHIPPKRSQSLNKFILDTLVATGNTLRIKHLRAYDDLEEKADWKIDCDLTRPFKEAKEKAEMIQQRGFGGFVDELEVIKAHVVEVREAYRIFWTSTGKRNEKKKSPDFARQFVEGPSEHLVPLTTDVGAIKASYAYQLSANFALTVAFRELCTIKATASQHLPVTRSFAEAMTIGSSFLRVLAERGDE